MPQHICTACISYLKHATNFRRQAFRTLLNLRYANKLVQSGAGKPDASQANETIPTDSNAPDNESTANPAAIFASHLFKPDGIPLANQQPHAEQKSAPNDNMSAHSDTNIAAKRRELDLFFGADLSLTSSTTTDDEFDNEDDDNNDCDGAEPSTLAKQRTTVIHRRRDDPSELRRTLHAFFNYNETPYRQDSADDDSRLLADGRVGLRDPNDDIPGRLLERKCPTCKRQFLRRGSYELHIRTCVPKRLHDFVGDCQRLVGCHVERLIAEQEFIRRMVYTIKSVVIALAVCCREVSAPDWSDVASRESKVVPKKMFNGWPERPPSVMIATTETDLAGIVAEDSASGANMTRDAAQIPTDGTEMLPKCFVCMQQVESYTHLRKHVRKHFQLEMDPPVKCAQCYQEFDDYDQLETHYTMHFVASPMGSSQSDGEDGGTTTTTSTTTTSMDSGTDN